MQVIKNLIKSLVKWNLSQVTTINQKLSDVNKRCDALLEEIQRLKSENNPIVDVIRPVNVLFTVPLEDRNGVPLVGNVGNAFADFTIEGVGNNGLTITRFVPDMKRPTSNHIHLEVIGTGTLEIIIRQTLTVDGGPVFIATNKLCDVEINSNEQQYTVNSIQSMAISDMLTLYTPNRINSND
jgi:hypothetical protein